MTSRQSLSDAGRAERDPAHPRPAAAGAPARAPAQAHPLLSLQRAYGNHYVQRLLRGALTEADEAGETDEAVHRANMSGMPDNLKSGIESLSGLPLDDVKVHYNSPEPAKLHALAYTRGTNIYLGPGQAGQLPHEAWHVVQQKQGRVTGARRGHSGASVADDPVLERAADRYVSSAPAFDSRPPAWTPGRGGTAPSASGPIQCRMGLEFETGLEIQDQHNYTYGLVLVSGDSGWEAIFDNGSLEIRTSPDDSYGSLEQTMRDVQQFIALVKDRLDGAPSVTLPQVADSQSGEKKFHCTGDGINTVISRRLGSDTVQLVVKERIRKIESQMGDVHSELKKLVPPKPGSKSLRAEDMEGQIKTLPQDTREKVEALRHTGKQLKGQHTWESHTLKDADLLAQPQVTFGVPLSELHLLLRKARATPLLAYGEQFKEAGAVKDPTTLIPRPIIDTAVIRQVISDADLESAEARERYVGFLSLVCLYAQRGMRDAFLADTRPEYVKSYFDVMSRTDFNSIYQMLSDKSKKHFRGRGEDTVIGIVWRNLQNDNAEIANRQVLGRGVTIGKIGPTLGQWIESIYNPGFRDSDRLTTTEATYTTKSRRGKGGKPEYYTEEREKEVPSQFAVDLKNKYVDVDKKLMAIPDIQKHYGGKSLGGRDLLSRGEVLYDSQSMGLLGLDTKDPSFPGKSLVLLEFRGIQGELYSRYWTQLAEQLFKDFRFTLRFGNYEFQTDERPAVADKDLLQFRLQEFLSLFIGDPAWSAIADPRQFWPVALANRFYYNFLRELFRDMPR